MFHANVDVGTQTEDMKEQKLAKQKKIWGRREKK